MMKFVLTLQCLKLSISLSNPIKDMFAFISYHCFTMTWLSQRWICRATRPSIPCRFQNLRMCCLNKVSEKNTYIPRFSVSQLVQDFGTSILDRLLHKSAVMPFFLIFFPAQKTTIL